MSLGALKSVSTAKCTYLGPLHTSWAGLASHTDTLHGSSHAPPPVCHPLQGTLCQDPETDIMYQYVLIPKVHIHACTFPQV